MMKWFYTWLGNKIDRATGEELEDAVPTIATGAKYRNQKTGISLSSDREKLDSVPITFKMYKASGGWAVEFRRYDSKTDNVTNSLYVITGEEELGQQLSHIITMEALKR